MAVVVGFGIVQERRGRDLARRLARVERDRAELRRRVDATAYEVDRRWAEVAYEQTMSGRRQPVPHIPGRALLSGDDRAGEVRAALLAAADGIGFEVAYEHPTGRRPHFEWIVLRQRRADDGQPAQRLADLGDDIRRAVRDPRPGGPDLPALTQRCGPAVVQLGLGVLVSDGRRLVYAALTTAQARALEEEREIFRDPVGLLARLNGDPAYRLSDLTDRVAGLPLRQRRSGAASPAAVAGAAVAGAAVAGAAVAGAAVAGAAVAGAGAGGGGAGVDNGVGGAGAAPPDEAVGRAVAELDRLATKVARLAGDRPASPDTLRALEEVRRRITRLSAEVDPAPDVAAPPGREAGDRTRQWRDRLRAFARTPSAGTRPPGPGGLAAELKAVADALRGGRPSDDQPKR